MTARLRCVVKGRRKGEGTQVKTEAQVEQVDEGKVAGGRADGQLVYGGKMNA